MKIIALGNEHIEADSLAINLAKEISKELDLEIEIIQSTGEYLTATKDQKNLLIIDVAKDIKELTLINSIDKLQVSKITSLHDFDIAYYMKLQKELGEVKEIKIIALPIQIPKEHITKTKENLKKQIQLLLQ